MTGRLVVCPHAPASFGVERHVAVRRLRASFEVTT